MVVIVVSPSTSVKIASTDAATTTVEAADEQVPVEADSRVDSPADSLGRRNLRVGVHATPLHTPPPGAIVTAVLGRGAKLYSTFTIRFEKILVRSLGILHESLVTQADETQHEGSVSSSFFLYSPPRGCATVGIMRRS